MNNGKHMEYLKRERECLSRWTDKMVQNGGYPDGNETRLKDLALEAAIKFYNSEEVSKIGEFELFSFLRYFKDAIEMRVLSPIEKDEFWKEENPGLFINERNQHLQKIIEHETGGILYLDISQFCTINIRNLKSHFPDEVEFKILMDLFPTEFPYTPTKEWNKLFVDDDGRQKYVMYAISKDGKTTAIKKKFVKNEEGKWEEAGNI